MMEASRTVRAEKGRASLLTFPESEWVDSPSPPPPPLVAQTVARALDRDACLRSRFPERRLLDPSAVRVERAWRHPLSGSWRFVARTCLLVAPRLYAHQPRSLCVRIEILASLDGASPQDGFVRMAHRVLPAAEGGEPDWQGPESAFGLLRDSI